MVDNQEALLGAGQKSTSVFLRLMGRTNNYTWSFKFFQSWLVEECHCSARSYRKASLLFGYPLYPN